MGSTVSKIEYLKGSTKGYWPERILAQLQYSVRLSKVKAGKYDDIIGSAVDFLCNEFTDQGAITRQAAEGAERLLTALSGPAREFKVILAAHAHIDLNWYWTMAETVAVTLDTFRTMLLLMKEYPEFVFSQSQAALYRIVEEYDPSMLEEIKERVREGRWEVTASAWCEADKNMPNGESHVRQILYAKNYLSRLLGIEAGSLNIGFEPDTFGHNGNLPQILVQGGIKYYYHCRGYDKHSIYRWKAPSGSSVLVYREPLWYHSSIGPELAICVPGFCSEHGMDTMLKVYGVGDHGGGPTRRDLEKIKDMSRWPVFPELRFGTFREYFSKLEEAGDGPPYGFPIEEKELNPIFTGCYTSQTRIKTSNRTAEARLYEAEAFGAVSSVFLGAAYKGETFENAWQKVMFNQFHDILTGAGTADCREYALGQFQQVLASANTEAVLALRNIAGRTDTSGLIPAGSEDGDVSGTVSEGAGVGFGVRDFSIPQVERGRGSFRIFQVFNPSLAERHECAEIIVWDWPGSIDRLEIRDAAGSRVQHQLLDNDVDLYYGTTYWRHNYIKLLVDVRVPALGYSTYVLSETEADDIPVRFAHDHRVHGPEAYVLENDRLKVTFSTSDLSIASLEDKSDGTVFIDGSRPAGIFRVIDEEDRLKVLTAWIVGRYTRTEDLRQGIRVVKTHIDKSALRQWITYETSFRSSVLKVTISLDRGSTRLNYNVECDWQEKPVRGISIPQLNFHLPVSYKCSSYKYDIPFGTVTREGMEMDVPSNGSMAAIPENGSSKALMLAAATKYGFRGNDGSMALSLIRSSYDTDPYPETGIHKFRFAVDLFDSRSNGAFLQKAFDYNHPLVFVSTTAHKGSLPSAGSFMSLTGGTASISSVKLKEGYGGGSGSRLIVRLYETDGNNGRVGLKFAKDVTGAYFTDINENAVEGAPAIDISGSSISFGALPYGISNICVIF